MPTTRTFTRYLADIGANVSQFLREGTLTDNRNENTAVANPVAAAAAAQPPVLNVQLPQTPAVPVAASAAAPPPLNTQLTSTPVSNPAATVLRTGVSELYMCYPMGIKTSKMGQGRYQNKMLFDWFSVSLKSIPF